MTFVSRLALAAVLTLGTTALTATPAAAQKKKDDKADQAGPQLQVGPEFRKAAAAAETALKAKDWATMEPQIVAAEGLAKNDDEKYYSAWLRFQLELNRQNEAGQIAPLQALVSNPKTPADHIPPYNARLNFLLGKQAAAKKDNAGVIQYMSKARELGSNQLDIPLLMANAYAATNRNVEAVAETGRAIELVKASGQKAPEAWYQFAIPKVNATGDRAATAGWLTRYIGDYPTVKNWRWAIKVFGLGAPSGNDRAAKVEKIDAFRLMRATNALADRSDYADYAYAAQSSGLPWEAIAVIDEGRNSGKLPKEDADANRTYTAAQSGVKGSPSLDTLAKQGQAAKDGAGAAQNADALLAAGDNARALALYDAALAKGGVDTNEVNLHRGVALHRLGRKDEARAAFQQVKTGQFANLALLWQASVDFPPLS